MMRVHNHSPLASSESRAPSPPRTRWWRAPMLSPRGLLLRALALAILYAALSLAGGRARAGFLSGTPVGGLAATLLGCAYVFAHFAFVVVAPILTIAAALLALALRRADQ